MGGCVVSLLEGWDVRGWSYGERTESGELHPGADLNVGGGDAYLGLPMVCVADGVVVWREEWDGRNYGYDNFGMVEHTLGAEGDITTWRLYVHLDHFDEAFQVGRSLCSRAAGGGVWEEWLAALGACALRGAVGGAGRAGAGVLGWAVVDGEAE